MKRTIVDNYREGRKFYVDATNGNDANNGRSPDAALKTIGQVNGMSFAPGETVLFKRDETWTGTCLVVPSNWMTLRDYGVGANEPKIDGNDLANCMTATNIDGLRLLNMCLYQGIDAGLICTTCTNVFIVECEMSDAGNDNLLFITSCDNCKVTGGEYHDSYKRVADGRLVTGVEITNGCDNMILDDVESYEQQDDAGSGIGIHSHDGEAMPTNITVRNCYSHDNVGHGLSIWKQDDTEDTDRNITIEDNRLIDNGENGLQIAKTAGADEYPDGIIISGNEVEGNGNYAYIISGNNLEVYQNEFVGRGYINGCVDSNFYNNTFYAVVGGGLYSAYIQDARTDGLNFKNNIVFCSVAGGMAIGVAAGVVNNPDIDYNLYHLDAEAIGNTRWHWKGANKSWANWLLDTGEDANSPEPADPLFTSDTDPYDFTLQAGSPAIDAGQILESEYLGDAPDCGAHERE